jgi:hypothetical protein
MLTAASSSSESPTATTFRMHKKKHPQLQNSRDKEKKHNTLLAASSSSESPTATTFRMQKKKNPTTAELQGQGKKHNTLPTASSSSESPTTNTFRMPKKKTPTIAELQGQGKKHNTLLAASSSSESPTATTFRMQNKKKKKHTHNCRIPGTRKKNTTQVSSCSLVRKSTLELIILSRQTEQTSNSLMILSPAKKLQQTAAQLQQF